MKISAKLLGSVLIIFVAAFGGLAYLADRSARSALVFEAAQQLEVVRRSRAEALTTYFNSSYDGLKAAAGGVTPDVLLHEMPRAIRRLPREVDGDTSDRRARLIDYYKTTIEPGLIRSGIAWPSAEGYVSRLGEEAIALQSEAFVGADAHRTAYGALHAQYHPRVVDFARSSNWLNVILVTADGTVVYTMQKGIELGVNLRSDPWKGTRLADAVEHAIHSDARDRRFFTDYAPYAPAFGTPMSFMSTPVFGTHDTDGLLGAIVLFVSLNEIERTLTEHSGFGSTEETYAVGPDLRMRSSSRFHAEPTSLKLVVDTDAVHRALAGEAGTIQQLDYRKERVLSSFAPLSFAGVTWAILAEIDIKEVLIPARALRLRIVWLFVAFTAVAGALLVFVLRRVVLAPIGTLTHAAQRIEHGDFEQPVALDTADEFGQLGRVVNTMMGSVRSSLHSTQARLAESQIDLRQVAARLNNVREQERSRLARDVHDQLGQALTAFKMDVAEVRRRLGRDDYSGAGARLEEVSCRIDAAIDETRRLASELHPPALDDVGVIDAMRGYLLDYSRRTGIAGTFDADVAPAAPPLPKDHGTALFRILQEGLTNVVRHAEATHVDVRLTVTRDEVALVVRDDGRGIPPAGQRARGLGVVGMRDRALLFGGDVSIAGEPTGTTVTARLPLAEDS